MKLKSYIPFLTVPLSFIMLTILSVDIIRGEFESRTDLYRFVIGGTLCIIWIISGLIKWNKPYITTNDDGLSIRNRWFSNQPSIVISWSKIEKHSGRTLYNFKLILFDGEIIKIPINGMLGKDLNSLISLIERKSNQ